MLAAAPVLLLPSEYDNLFQFFKAVYIVKCKVVIELTLLFVYLFIMCLKHMLKKKNMQHLLYTYALGELIPPPICSNGKVSLELCELRIMWCLQECIPDITIYIGMVLIVT